MKQQDLNRMAIFLGHKLPIPQEEHIADTINKIEAILQKKKINKFVNASAKEGYTKALEILKNNDVTFNRYDELKNYTVKIHSCHHRRLFERKMCTRNPLQYSSEIVLFYLFFK